MTSLRRLGCAAVLIAAGLVPGLGSSAQAESATVDDKATDASVIYFEERSQRSERAPDERFADVLGASFDYRLRNLVVTATVADTPGEGKTLRAFIRVRGGGTETVFTRAKRGTIQALTPTGKNAFDIKKCKGGKTTVSAETNTIRTRIPARCFDTPGRVRVGVSVGRPETNGMSEPRYFVDDASSVRIGSFARFVRPRFAEVVRRG